MEEELIDILLDESSLYPQEIDPAQAYEILYLAFVRAGGEEVGLWEREYVELGTRTIRSSAYSAVWTILLDLGYKRRAEGFALRLESFSGQSGSELEGKIIYRWQDPELAEKMIPQNNGFAMQVLSSKENYKRVLRSSDFCLDEIHPDRL